MTGQTECRENGQRLAAHVRVVFAYPLMLKKKRSGELASRVKEARLDSVTL